MKEAAGELSLSIDGEVEAFANLLPHAPGPAIHWANFGAFELEAGRFAEAVRFHREAVDRDPANQLAYEGRLEAALAVGDREQVRRAREAPREPR